jgi:hypothetical protein
VRVRDLRLCGIAEYAELAAKYLGDASEEGRQSTVAEMTTLLGDMGALVHIPQDVRLNHVVIADPKWLYTARSHSRVCLLPRPSSLLTGTQHTPTTHTRTRRNR